MYQRPLLPLAVVLRMLRYQAAALIAASIIGGGPWTFNADAATFTVEPTQIVFSNRTNSVLLTLRNEWLDERLRVDNDGSFPVFTVGAGLDVPLRPRRDWFLEIGAAYFWGRLEHAVAARGSLAPSPEVVADTDSTGPNYWIGLCWRSGASRPGAPP